MIRADIRPSVEVGGHVPGAGRASRPPAPGRRTVHYGVRARQPGTPGDRPVNLIEVATVFAAATNLALAFSYFFLWRKVLRRRYVALLAAAGVLGLAEILVAYTFRTGAPWSDLAAAAAGGLGTIAWIGGCYDFVRRRIPALVLSLTFAALIGWSLIAPHVTSGFLARESGDALIKGALGLWIALIFWRGPRVPGRGVLSLLLALQGLHQLDEAYLGNKSWGIVTGLAISDFFGIAIALFLLMMVLEEARQEAMLARESLRRSEALAELGQLVGGVAHEVRNPLTAISAGLQTLSLAEPELMRRHSELLGELKSALDRMTALTRDLLVYGKPTEPDLDRGDPGEVIRRAAVVCAPIAERAGVTVDVEVTEPLPSVTMDRSRLLQVFVNLITNAIQHSASGGRVVASCVARPEHHPRQIEWEVADAGPGFSPELLRQVFHPFASRRPGGTGLGLAIARRLVEQQRGEISAQNGPGGGALLRVTLPVSAASGSRSAA